MEELKNNIEILELDYNKIIAFIVQYVALKMLEIKEDYRQYYNTDPVVILNNLYNDVHNNYNDERGQILKVLETSQNQLKKYCFIKMDFEM